MEYQTKEDLLEVLRQTPQGTERQKILYRGHNRKLVENSGANVTFYCGKMREGLTVKEKLSSIFLFLIARLNPKTGKNDGIGALGGLAERTNKSQFEQMTEQQKQNLLGLKDDVILQNNHLVLTTDINIIRQNNVKRELREEFKNIGLSSDLIDFEQLKLVDMPGICDDNYLINIWNGEGDVFAVTPYCHILQLDEKILDSLVKSSQKTVQQKNSEVARFFKIPLFDALKCYGNYGDKVQLEDGRSAIEDYRYPHEWLISWILAAHLLENKAADLLTLMSEVRQETSYNIDFQKAAEKMRQDLKYVAELLKIDEKSMLKIQQMNTSFNVRY